ncbi:unnamed protein product, partial [Prorocentrum cordatum]
MRPSAFPRSPCGPPTIYVCMPSFVPRLAPRLQLGRGPRAQLAPERTLVAGLFAHGEVGLDAVASRAPPEAAAGALLRELATYKRLRWLDAGAGGAAAADGAELKALLAGCALRSREGLLYAGSSVGAASSEDSITPLQTALVSLGVNGEDRSDQTSESQKIVSECRR